MLGVEKVFLLLACGALFSLQFGSVTTGVLIL